MKLSIFAGSANPSLAEGITTALGVSLAERVLERYPDVELQKSVRGHDVFLFQPTAPPVEEQDDCLAHVAVSGTVIGEVVLLVGKPGGG